MSYISKNLMGGEEIVHEAHLHWFVFVPTLLFLGVGLWMFGGMFSGNPETAGDRTGVAMLGFIFILISPFTFISAFIRKKTTELGVTTKRVVAKYGFIKRNTVELNHGKVESFSVDQSILGRIFGFGTVTIQGTGGGKTPIKGIASPMKFRQEAMEIIDNSGLNQYK